MSTLQNLVTACQADKSRLQPEMDLLLSSLIALDPANAAVRSTLRLTMTEFREQ